MNFFKKIEQLISTITFVIGLWKPISEAVKQIEEEAKGWKDATGEAKKQAVLNILATALDLADEIIPGLDLPREKVLNVAGYVIDIVVAFYNAIGVFKHSGDSEGNA
jgi:hypothetical protein